MLALESDREQSIAATLAEAKAAVREDGAAAIVFGCTGMLGFAQPVADGLGGTLPVIDPLPHATLAAHEAVLAGERTDKAVYPSPEQKRVTGFSGWRALDAMMRGEPRE